MTHLVSKTRASAAPRPLRHLATAILTLLLAAQAQAAGSGMPWEAPLQSILDSIEGPVAKILATIVIILTGLGLAFGRAIGREGPPSVIKRPVTGGGGG